MTDALHSAEDRLRAIADMQPPFAHLLGARIVRATRDLVTAELVVREELTNRNGGLHGGAVMAVADNLGGTAAFLNLPEGAGTTTIESKTNSSPRSRSATRSWRNARPFTAAAPPWCGRRGSPAPTASSPLS